MEETFSLSRKLIVSEPLPDRPGYTWTLASRFGQMLTLAEEQFGPRDLSYTILGFEFGENAPALWYPGDCKHIVIRLDTQCSHNPLRACYQLAHECIHILSPTGSSRTSILEEGIAVLFQESYILDVMGSACFTDIDAYRQAAQYASRLLEHDSHSIKTMRETIPIISNFTTTHILECCPKLPDQLAQILTQPFSNPAVQNDVNHAYTDSTLY